MNVDIFEPELSFIFYCIYYSLKKTNFFRMPLHHFHCYLLSYWRSQKITAE